MKNKGWTYKRKNQILAIATLLFLVFFYNAVITITIDLFRANKNLNKKVQESLNAPQKEKALEARLERFEQSLNKYFIDSIKNREYILGVVSDYCKMHHLILSQYPESKITKEKEFEIETNTIEVEGGFINLLKLVYELEHTIKIARPASVSFENKYDHKRRKEVLTATLYLQNLRMKENE